MDLTDKSVRAAKARSKDYRMADGQGLSLLVKANGSKLWHYRYRFRGDARIFSIGSYPDVSLARAREVHAEARKLLASGNDPVAERKAGKEVADSEGLPTFNAIATLWHEHWSVGLSERHTKNTWSRIVDNVLPALGNKRIDDIEAPDLVAMLKAIQARGVYDLAKRALETSSLIFRYGIANGHCKRNPAADIKPSDVIKAVVKKNFARVEAKEVPELMRAIETYQGRAITRLALKLMAHIFLRTSELIGGQWPEVDFDEARWNIPPWRMKNRKPHIVHMSTQATEILRLLHDLTGGSEGDLMFPADFTTGEDFILGEYTAPRTMSNNTILQALARMGYKHKMTGHGFRGIASTVLHEQGFEHAHIELQLSHSNRDAVSAAYNHALYLKPRAEMMQWWSDYLDAAQKKR